MLAAPPSLLITDDDLALRETMRDVFESRGFRALLAADGQEALEILQAEPIHLLLLDLHMPRLGGLQTLRLAKQYKAMLPCIVMSAGLDERVIHEVRQANAFSVLPKPVARDELTSVVDRALWQTYHWRR